MQDAAQATFNIGLCINLAQTSVKCAHSKCLGAWTNCYPDGLSIKQIASHTSAQVFLAQLLIS